MSKCKRQEREWEGWNGNEAENVFKNKKLDVFRRQKGSNILLSAVTEWVLKFYLTWTLGLIISLLSVMLFYITRQWFCAFVIRSIYQFLQLFVNT